MATNTYYGLVYLTRTGQVVGDVPLGPYIPAWSQIINTQNTWTVWIPVGGTGLPKDRMLEYIQQEMRFSLAICYGEGTETDPVCQAGPITASTGYGLIENTPVLQLGGIDMFGFLSSREQFASTWNGLSVASGAGADTSYGPLSYQGIAVGLIQNQINRDTLPIDLPSAIAGTNTMSYYGYDMVSTGQRLMELSQLQNGPDILFRPYQNGQFIRHQAIIGNPLITPSSVPLYFDYPGNVSSIMPTRNAQNMASTVYVKGNGTEYGMLWSSATDSTLPGQGWPLIEYVDGTHSSITDQPTLNGYASADLGLYGRSVETWVARARMDLQPVFGSYQPGQTVYYQIKNHPFRADGLYPQRLLGFQVMQGDAVGDVRHVLQNTAGSL